MLTCTCCCHQYLPQTRLHLTCNAVEQFLQQRQSALQKEAADNQQAAVLLGLDQQACCTLAQVVSQLRSIESSVSFQALLQQNIAAVSGAAVYSSDNFAYNSTPFASWAKVGRNSAWLVAAVVPHQ